MPDEILEGDSLSLSSETLTMEVTTFKPMFGSVEGADRYFSERLDSQLWEIADLTTRQKALMTATRGINNLRFAGRKTDEGQPLEFPRNGETEVPQAVQEATYEEALALLKGIDPETEAANIFVNSRAFGKVRTDYGYRTAPQHVVARIASSRAWSLLTPLLDQSREIRLRRVS